MMLKEEPEKSRKGEEAVRKWSRLKLSENEEEDSKVTGILQKVQDAEFGRDS